MDLSIVILAAGQGKRMKSDLPKVLQPLAGRPLLAHVLDTARSLEPAAIHVVYGHQGDLVREAFPDEPVSWVLQAEQHGTGHAALQAAAHIPDSHQVLILYGDVPLIRVATLAALVAQAGPKSVAVLTRPATGASCATPRAACGASSRRKTHRRACAGSARATPA